VICRRGSVGYRTWTPGKGVLFAATECAVGTGVVLYGGHPVPQSLRTGEMEDRLEQNVIGWMKTVEANVRVGNPVGGSTVKPLQYLISKPYSVVEIGEATVRKYPFKSLAHEYASNVSLHDAAQFADVGPTQAEIEALPIIFAAHSLSSLDT